MKRLGLLGGTFNPVHFAHLRLAEVVREALQLDRVFFVPAGDPPLKSDHLAPARDRLAMVERAIEDHPDFGALDLEVRRPGKSYTVDTLAELTTHFAGDSLWFVLGADALAELDAWRDSARLFELANFAYVERPGSAREPKELLPARLQADFQVAPNGLRHRSGHELRRVALEPLGISATHVRACVARGASIRYLVPDGVIQYIDDHQLYREPV